MQSTANQAEVLNGSVERNRGCLYSSTQSAIAGLELKQQIGLVSIDIRGFTGINMMFGFQNGDTVLFATAERLAQALRVKDVTYRTGDDEFSILLNPVIHRDHALLAVNKIQQVFEKPFTIEGVEHTLEVDIGLALYPETAASAEELIRQSVFALHRAKREYGDCVVYDAVLDLENRRRQQLSQEIKAALDIGHIKLVYQPIFDPRERRFVGVESLARWIRNADAAVSPGEFIPIIEQTGLMGKFTQLVLNTALRECSDFGGCFISVNVSAINLEEIAFPDLVRRALSTWKVEPPRLILEVTETSIMRNLDSTRFVLDRLAKLGVKLAIDDFGSGYSSLQYIRELPVSYLKIDAGFIKNLNKNSNDIAIVDAVCKLGHSFELQVIAEGVETEEGGRIATKLGCDLLQGYRLAKPMEPALISNLFINKN